MTPNEWLARATAHLDKLNDADFTERVNDRSKEDAFSEIVTRWSHAQLAFPDMSWEEFCALNKARARTGKRGRPTRSLIDVADERIWRAARDADRLKELWRELSPANPRPRAPLHPHEIVAKRHDLKRQVVDDAMRRPQSRRIDRKAAHN